MTSEFPLRIRVQDVWDDVRLAVPASVLAGDIKRRALRATRVAADPDGYVLKFRGAEVSDSVSLEDAGVVPNANLIVLHRRRRPVVR
jgi:hypothetical protein